MIFLILIILVGSSLCLGQKKEFKIGDIVEFGDYKIVVHSLKKVDTVYVKAMGDERIQENASKGTKYILVNVTLKKYTYENPDKSLRFELKDANGKILMEKGSFKKRYVGHLDFQNMDPYSEKSGFLIFLAEEDIIVKELECWKKGTENPDVVISLR